MSDDVVLWSSHQIALVALLPHHGGFVKAATLSATAGISMPTVHAELRPLVEAGVLTYDSVHDEYEVSGD